MPLSKHQTPGGKLATDADRMSCPSEDRKRSLSESESSKDDAMVAAPVNRTKTDYTSMMTSELMKELKLRDDQIAELLNFIDNAGVALSKLP
jgi:hypothetical protein